MLSAPLAAPSPQRYYAGSDSCRASYTTRQASPVHPLAFWTCHPQPRRAPGTSRALPPRASGRLVAEPGFAETLGSSPLHAAESGSYSYSLPVRLQLLPTPSRSDATTLPLERRSCFQLYVRQLHTVRTHTVLTNELTDALGCAKAPTRLSQSHAFCGAVRTRWRRGTRNGRFLRHNRSACAGAPPKVYVTRQGCSRRPLRTCN